MKPTDYLYLIGVTLLAVAIVFFAFDRATWLGALVMAPVTVGWLFACGRGR
jgi:hypothetical protein